MNESLFILLLLVPFLFGSTETRSDQERVDYIKILTIVVWFSVISIIGIYGMIAYTSSTDYTYVIPVDPQHETHVDTTWWLFLL